ncbi:putative quinol monooxygenase [Terriglobus aquaticus]|uniref:Quinol monooxygenase n=1 Tax=Terriglobus aquaticus TaxID=940139 RepID=A0ABW9KGF9_9BACT|nr:antibiotic biosynthesis monooxygenase [Terriglobus aquaticus]
MDRCGILVLLEAKPGKEQEVADLLTSAKQLVLQEPDTLKWFAFQTGPATFGIFDTFADEDGRQAHATGEVAKALFAKAEELFASAPQLHMADLLATK